MFSAITLGQYIWIFQSLYWNRAFPILNVPHFSSLMFIMTTVSVSNIRSLNLLITKVYIQLWYLQRPHLKLCGFSNSVTWKFPFLPLESVFLNKKNILPVCSCLRSRDEYSPHPFSLSLKNQNSVGCFSLTIHTFL